jgi:hypothetical protein
LLHSGGISGFDQIAGCNGAKSAAVGGVHIFAFRSPTGLSSVRHLVHFFALRLPKLSDRATLANPPIT